MAVPKPGTDPLANGAPQERPGINPLSAKRPSERSRARELYRYYQPPPSSDRTPTVQDPASAPPRIASSDPSLIAYAQLTAIRLNCHRCMISLIDNTTQYIIAECTQTISPFSPLDHGPGDGLWLGGSEIIPRLGGLCENTVMLESTIRPRSESGGQSASLIGQNIDFEMAFYNEQDHVDNLPIYEVEDLSKSDKFCSYPFVMEAPALRYYCGVPLRTKKGYHIGSLCVVDGKPRKLGAEEKRMLRWMANTVMQHLETVAEKNALRKVQRMQASLSRFVAGDWSDSTGITTPRFKGKNGFVRTRSKNRRESNSDEREEEHGVSRRTTGAKRKQSHKTTPNLEEPADPVSPLYSTPQRPAIFDRNSSASSGTSLQSKFSKLSTSQSSATTVESLPSIVVTPKPNTVSDVAPLVPEATFKNTFTRASSLIRDALEVCGVIFMDAEMGHWTDMSVTSTSAKSPSVRPSESILRSPKPSKERSSSVLGFATETSSSPLEFIPNRGNTLQPPEMELDPSTVGRLKESFLQTLLQKYPSGNIFSYDSDGNFSSSDEAGNEELDPTLASSEEDIEYIKLKRNVIGREMSGFMPGSKSCIFVPLFDYSGKAFAASFAWTNSNTRIFLKDELGYMTAFANSIMAEVSRLHTIVADRAKGNFISSISHELRSPLHGILASAEFLTDTKLDTFQGSLVETVESCGRTLLDTINHVLDFSKLNSLHNDARLKGAAGKRRSGQNQRNQIDKINNANGPKKGPDGAVLNLVAQTNIAAVTEEVVEGVFAGYEFRGVNTTALMENSNDPNIVPLQPETAPPSMGKPRSSNRDHMTLLMGKKEDIVVIVDIARRENWKFVTQPGAFRRILMNVFGNSLKYTTRGFVRVKLDAEDYNSSDESTTSGSDTDEATYDGARMLVTLTVSDSGRGISREFLKTKLFTPFSQENALASGAGLGMSIVRQIVEILGGTIDVKSELGVGTEVKITFVLEHDIANPDQPMPSSSLSNAPYVPSFPSTVDDCEETDVICQVQAKAAGKRIVVLGFDGNPADIVGLATMEQLRSSFETYARDWYNMVVVPPIAGASLLDYAGKVDVILSNESPSLLSQLHSKGAKPPTVVLCSNAARYDMYTTRAQADQGGVIDFASKPCGPHKLAKALFFCLCQTDISRRSSTSSGRSGATLTAIKSSTPRPIFDRGKSYQSNTSAKGSTAGLEEESVGTGAIRFSPPVRSGSMSSEPVVYVPGIGMMAAASGSSVVPLNSGRRRSIPYFEDLPEILKEEESKNLSLKEPDVSVSPPRKGRNSPRPTKAFIAANPPHMGAVFMSEGLELEGRPSLASPVIEKDNPLRPKSWAQWQSLDASANDVHGILNGGGSASSSLSELLSKPAPAERPTMPTITQHLSAGKKAKVDTSLPTVLIVEDNPINLMLLATFMAKKKYPFRQAENGLLALQAVEAAPNGFDVIIMDIQMPVMSGIEATRAIRILEAQRGPHHRSTIIALTGLAASDDQMEAFQSGVDYFVTKPISMKKIEAYLQKRRDGPQ